MNYSRPTDCSAPLWQVAIDDIAFVVLAAPAPVVTVGFAETEPATFALRDAPYFALPRVSDLTPISRYPYKTEE